MADGKITIDTSIDNSGFEKGAEELHKSAKSQAAKLAAQYKKQGYSASDAWKKAWSEIPRETKKGSEKASKYLKDGLGKSIKETANSTKQIAERIAGLKSSFSGLLKIGALSLGGFGLFEFGKSAIELGSSVSEVQNVVDTAFGDMAYKAEQFADSAIQNFGMSELAAKKTSSTYMAMARGMGVAMDAASDMSIELAGLSGDVASFYNITQEEAAYKLQSVFTGETESLKELGVVMTQTNLQQYAMANGMNSNIQSMTQAEQVALRYAYVTEQLSLASGDFVKTQDSWANQTRILSMQWQQFMSIIGQSLIQVLTPVLQFLNAFVAQLVQWATTVNQIISSLFGGSVTASAGSAQTAMAGAASAADDFSSASMGAADSTESAAAAQDDLASSAADANKELEKQTASFDEMNILQSKASSASGGSGGTGGAGGGGISGGIGSIDTSGITSVQDQIETSMSEIQKLIESQDWAGLGKYIADGINEGMQKVYDVINWDNVRPKVEPFITGFTETFNSLVDNIDWDLMGRTLGAGINTVVGTLVLLIDGIDWINIGASFAEGLNGAIDEIDWNNVGRLIGLKFMIAWDVFYGFVTNLDWHSIGLAIANGINGVLSSIDLGQIVSGLSAFVVGILTSLTIAIQNTDWTAVGQQIANALAAIDWVGIGSGLFSAGLTLLGGLLEAFTQLPGPVQIAAGVVGGFYTVAKGKELFDTLSTKYTQLKDFFDKTSTFITETAIPKITEGFDKFKTFITDTVVPKVTESFDKFKTFMTDTVVPKITESFDKFKTFIVDTAIPKITGAFSTFKDFIVTTVIPKITTSISGFFAFLAANPVILIIAGITAAVVALVALIATKGDEIQALLQKVNDFLQNIFAKDWSKIFGPVLGEYLNAFMRNVKNIWDSIKKIFDGVIDFIRGVFTGDWERAWKGVKEIFGGIFNGLIALAKAPLNGIIGLLNMAINGINELIKGFNGIGFDLPDWLGGGSWHPNIPTIPKIPYLAQGAVLPANKPFMAIVGDQKQGTNVEAPLDTIKQALMEVMTQQGAGVSGPITFVLKVGETTLGRATLKSLQDIARQNGGLALDLR